MGYSKRIPEVLVKLIKKLPAKKSICIDISYKAGSFFMSVFLQKVNEGVVLSSCFFELIWYTKNKKIKTQLGKVYETRTLGSGWRY